MFSDLANFQWDEFKYDLLLLYVCAIIASLWRLHKDDDLFQLKRKKK